MLSSGQLGFKVLKGKECVGCIEFLIVFPVAALNFSIVSGRIGLNQFMLDPKFSKSFLKESLFWVPEQSLFVNSSRVVWMHSMA